MNQIAADQDKPCIALIGEFSAGKSTLANLLIGSQPLPVQVVASHVPPVMISYGAEPPFRVDLDGVEHPIDVSHIAAAPLEDTAYVQIFSEADVLERCDLLDIPGISDPNMSPQIWQRMIARADGVLWCSHATQAWRQSEAAVWSNLPENLHAHSLLLLTRIDKVTNEKDREKIMRRVRMEVGDLFRACLPISLLQAAHEQNDYDAWLRTGAGDFVRQFKQILDELRPNPECKSLGETGAKAAPPCVSARPVNEQSLRRIVPRRIGGVRAVTPRPESD